LTAAPVEASEPELTADTAWPDRGDWPGRAELASTCWAGVDELLTEVGAVDDVVLVLVTLVGGCSVGGVTGGPDGALAEAALAGVIDTICTKGTVHTAAAPTTAPRFSTSRLVTPELIAWPCPSIPVSARVLFNSRG
jgi:hypothetical protein